MKATNVIFTGGVFHPNLSKTTPTPFLESVSKTKISENAQNLQHVIQQETKPRHLLHQNKKYSVQICYRNYDHQTSMDLLPTFVTP